MGAGRSFGRGWLVLALAALSVLLAVPVAFGVPADLIAYTLNREDCPIEPPGWFDACVVSADGSGYKEISLEGDANFVTWSPDGSRLAYARSYYHPDMVPYRQLWTTRADGSDTHLLSEWNRDLTEIAWSSTSDRYLAVADYQTSTKTARIVLYDVRTGKQTSIYSLKGGTRFIDLAWSPDARQIAFVQKLSGSYRCRIITVATRSVRDAVVRDARAVSWSRATGEMAFTQAEGGGFRVKTALPNGPVVTVFWPVLAGGTTWSPDGQQLAVDASVTMSNGIFALNRDGTGVRLVKTDYRSVVPHFIAQNPGWRPEAKRSAPRFEYDFPATCAYRGPGRIDYRFLDENGAPLAGKTIVLQSSSDGRTWGTMATRATDSQGRVTTYARPTVRRYYRAFFPGDGTTGQVTSQIGIVKPRVSLSTPKAPASVGKGSYFTVSGKMYPRFKWGYTKTSPVRLYFYRSETSGGSTKWVLRRVSTATVTKSGTGSKYSTRVSLPYTGSWSVRAYYPDEYINAETYSGARSLSVK